MAERRPELENIQTLKSPSKDMVGFVTSDDAIPTNLSELKLTDFMRAGLLADLSVDFSGDIDQLAVALNKQQACSIYVSDEGIIYDPDSHLNTSNSNNPQPPTVRNSVPESTSGHEPITTNNTDKKSSNTASDDTTENEADPLVVAPEDLTKQEKRKWLARRGTNNLILHSITQLPHGHQHFAYNFLVEGESFADTAQKLDVDSQKAMVLWNSSRIRMWETLQEISPRILKRKSLKKIPGMNPFVVRDKFYDNAKTRELEVPERVKTIVDRFFGHDEYPGIYNTRCIGLQLDWQPSAVRVMLIQCLNISEGI